MSTRTWILLGLGWLIALGIVGTVVVVRARQAHIAAAPGRGARAEASAEERKRSDLRIVLEEHRMDDPAREYIFRGILRGTGERCDKVERALMTKRGHWRVECTPGHVFLLGFDENGQGTEAIKLQ